MVQNAYQHGTSPRKLEPEYYPNKNRKKQENKSKQKTVKNAKIEKKKKVKQTLMVLAIFAVLFTISYRNSQINEKFSQMQNMKQELAALQKENEQTKVNIENSLNLNNIEKVAKEKLGMKKLSNQQTVYVDLPKEDYVETSSEKVVKEEEQNWFQKIISMIFNK